MNWFRIALVAGVLATASVPIAAEPACTEVAVAANVEAAREDLTLADLLRGDCPQLREAAAQVSLGAAPRAGSVRVFDGGQVRGLLEEFAGAGLSEKQISAAEIPGRIVVRRAGGTKRCEEIARFVVDTAPSQNAGAPAWEQKNLDCAAARAIPEAAPLELTQTAWNAALQRWEFSLRCARAGDCVPFLVWSGEPAAAGRILKSRTQRHFTFSADSYGSHSPAGAGGGSTIRRGQTATLVWDEAGIRVVLPVTCLDAGGVGQLVRVQLKNGSRILRAEVVGEGMLRAAL
jgi:hypothetical protein